MKKTSLLINLLLLIIVSSCKEKTVTKTLSVENNMENKVIFKIDERTEFLRTIFNIAVQEDLDEDIRPCQTEYLNRVNVHFSQFKNHPLIKWVFDNENIGIDFPTIGLMFKDLKNFEFNKAYSQELKYYNITEQTIDSLRPLMKDFHQKSGFTEFFNNNEEYYQKAISKIEKQVSEEKLFEKVLDFYQSEQKGLEFFVFVELTNNANNKAVDFYDNYNPNKRAMILANYCDLSTDSNSSNEIMELNNSTRGVIYHEISHLSTTKLLEKNIGDTNQYKTICEDCNDIEIMDKVDHLIIFPLQALMMQRFDNNNEGQDFYINKCTDVRKDIYKRLIEYKPENKIPFKKTYIDCINLIKQSVSK
jgi:hypothetical protein